MITCEAFLDGFSEYLDGELAAGTSEQFELHQEECEDCRRYRDIMVRSLSLVRALDPPAPSEVFRDRLNARLYLEEERNRAIGPLGSGTTSGTTFLMTLVFAAAAWSPTLAAPDDAQAPGEAATLAVAESQPPADAELQVATGMSSFAAGQISIYRAEELEEDLWSYPNAVFYAYSSLSRRKQSDPRVRAVGVQ